MNRRIVTQCVLFLVLFAGNGQLLAADPNDEQTASVLSEKDWRKNTEERLARIERLLVQLEKRMESHSGAQVNIDGVAPANWREEAVPNGSGRPKNDAAAAETPLLPIARQGLLIIDNRTGAYQTVTVNGRHHTLNPNRTEMWVPFGTVGCHLTYQALMKWNNWRWNGRHYELVVVLQ